jgi:hypothetical protein
MGANVFPTPFSGIQETLVDAKGDLVAASAADSPIRLAAGTNEHRLVADSGQTAGLKYVADTTNYAVAAKGDLLVGTGADTLAALTVASTAGYTLVADSAQATGLKYQAPTVNTVIDAEGDLLVGDTADTIQRLAIGSNAQVLTVDTAVDGKIKWATPAAGGGGKVLQVVYANYGTQTTSTSATFVDTGLTATITPTSASSTILVFVNQNGVSKTNDLYIAFKLFRGATELQEFETQAVFTNSSLFNNIGTSAYMHQDSPATTSATTYKTQFRRVEGSGDARVQTASAYSSITLLEIGA